LIGYFEAAFRHPQTRGITAEWIENYAASRKSTAFAENAVEAEPLPAIPEPHEIQVEALAALAATRAAGNKAGLVVLATGLGKTWLSAFDSMDGGFRRILFVAHREEILEQSLKTFRAIRPEARFGRYTGKERNLNADVLFASVQTLGRVHNLRVFDKDAFDYIVIDEFHHAAASTYRKIIDHFEPKFLLGLTATPERTDGGDLLALCDENLVYTCPVGRGISSGLLSPFHYFGVPDLVDYKNIPWRNSRFVETELTNALATEARAENALEQMRLRGGSRALGFCCSVRHADFMARFVNARGGRAAAVHSDPSSAPRTQSLEDLRDGKLDIVFTVDMFNEGVDVPTVDTVLMLRPTESRILWQQQFGRGLRKAEGKERLNVIDYIGNHRAFLLKPQTLFGLGSSDREIYEVLASYRAGTLELPVGCEVTYDLETVDILAGLLRAPQGAERLRQYYQDFVELHDRRPSALEADHDGMNPNSARQEYGSWLGFVKSMDGLSPEQASCFENHMQLLEDISITPMTKSYKMLLLLAMLNLDGMPGRIEIGELVRAFRTRASRSKVLSDDVGAAISDDMALRRHLEENPINAWVGGRGTGGRSWFAYEDGYLSTTFEVAPGAREPLQELVREVCDWRLAQYLRGATEGAREASQEFVCKVRSPRGVLQLQLPSRDGSSGVPYGATVVRANSEDYIGDFEHAALKVLKKHGQAEDYLAPILTGWFGSDAGQPGTDHRVSLRMLEGAWDLRPSQGEAQGGGPVLWKSYMRSEIPGLLGFRYVENLWRQGFVRQNNHLFLLVTLHKGGMAAEHQYEDKFLDRRTFEWQSQNRQARDTPSGRMLLDHKKLGLMPLLFVRAAGKVGSRTSPFHYCGDLEFVSWDGDRPITVRWALRNEMPEALYVRLNTEQAEI
jgi:superfamily II DNA or RNA helicase